MKAGNTNQLMKDSILSDYFLIIVVAETEVVLHAWLKLLQEIYDRLYDLVGQPE